MATTRASVAKVVVHPAVTILGALTSLGLGVALGRALCKRELQVSTAGGGAPAPGLPSGTPPPPPAASSTSPAGQADPPDGDDAPPPPPPPSAPSGSDAEPPMSGDGPERRWRLRWPTVVAWRVDSTPVRYMEGLPAYYRLASRLLFELGYGCREWRALPDWAKFRLVASLGFGRLAGLIYATGYPPGFGPTKASDGLSFSVSPRVVGTTGWGQPILDFNHPDLILRRWPPSWISSLYLPRDVSWIELAVLLLDRHCARRIGVLPPIVMY